MSNGGKMTVVAVLAAAVGFAGGWHSSSSEVEKTDARPKKVRGAIAEAGNDELVKSLKRRIAELEKAASRQSVEVEATTVATENDGMIEEKEGVRPDGGRFRRHGPEEFRARMEKLKKEDPEKYAEIRQRMSEGRARAMARRAGNLEFLSSIDTSAMSKQQRKTHEEYQALLAKEEELMKAMQPPIEGEESQQVSEEDREATMNAMRELHQRKRELESAERDILLNQTAEAIGLDGDDASMLIDTVKAVYEATGSRGGMHGAPPPPQ